MGSNWGGPASCFFMFLGSNRRGQREGSPSPHTLLGCLLLPRPLSRLVFYLPGLAFRGMEEWPAFLFKREKWGGAGMEPRVPVVLFHLPSRDRS